MTTTHPPTASLPTAPLTPTPYHLTEEQVAAFDRDGYLVLPGRVRGRLLALLQEAGRRWIERGLEHGVADEDYNWANRESGKALFRVNYVHEKGEAASLALLGSPEVLAAAESLCGRDFVPTYESMVFKMEGDGERIRWHQDAVHARRHRVFNLDLYLDPSRKGAGALWVVPGSQHARFDACALEATHGWDVPGAVEVEMEPGDILLHDTMVVH